MDPLTLLEIFQKTFQKRSNILYCHPTLIQYQESKGVKHQAIENMTAQSHKISVKAQRNQMTRPSMSKLKSIQGVPESSPAPLLCRGQEATERGGATESKVEKTSSESSSPMGHLLDVAPGKAGDTSSGQYPWQITFSKDSYGNIFHPPCRSNFATSALERRGPCPLPSPPQIRVGL